MSECLNYGMIQRHSCLDGGANFGPSADGHDLSTVLSKAGSSLSLDHCAGKPVGFVEMRAEFWLKDHPTLFWNPACPSMSRIVVKMSTPAYRVEVCCVSIGRMHDLLARRQTGEGGDGKAIWQLIVGQKCRQAPPRCMQSFLKLDSDFSFFSRKPKVTSTPSFLSSRLKSKDRFVHHTKTYIVRCRRWLPGKDHDERAQAICTVSV